MIPTGRDSLRTKYAWGKWPIHAGHPATGALSRVVAHSGPGALHLVHVPHFPWKPGLCSSTTHPIHAIPGPDHIRIKEARYSFKQSDTALFQPHTLTQLHSRESGRERSDRRSKSRQHNLQDLLSSEPRGNPPSKGDSLATRPAEQGRGMLHTHHPIVLRHSYFVLRQPPRRYRSPIDTVEPATDCCVRNVYAIASI